MASSCRTGFKDTSLAFFLAFFDGSLKISPLELNVGRVYLVSYCLEIVSMKILLTIIKHHTCLAHSTLPTNLGRAVKPQLILGREIGYLLPLQNAMLQGKQRLQGGTKKEEGQGSDFNFNFD